jgi:tetratricopeptide (TPR) repeat protein
MNRSRLDAMQNHEPQRDDPQPMSTLGEARAPIDPRANLQTLLHQILEVGTTSLDEAHLAVAAETLGPGAGEIIDRLGQFRRGEREAEELLELLRTERHQAVLRLREVNRAAGAATPPRRATGYILEQLAALPSYEAVEPIRRLKDVPVLWCLVRSGRIAERRAAVRRLGTLITEGKLADSSFGEREMIDGLSVIRDPWVAYEVDSALAQVAGAVGRAARQRLARADKLIARVRGRARRYWTGEEEQDPLDGLAREESLRLGVWMRRAPDDLAAHVAEHLQLRLGRGDPALLADAIGALIPSGDERLVPVLCRLLPDAPLAARIAAARALARIADPRVHRALIKAFRHATDLTELTVLGGALGHYGDDRGLELLFERLDEEDPLIWEEAVRSLGSVGDGKAAPRLLPLLESDRPALVRATARALIRCGGRPALEALQRTARRRPQQAGMLSDAAEALALRLRLLGQIHEEELLVKELGIPSSGALASRPGDELVQNPLGPPLSARLTSFGYYLLGLLWARLWQRTRALDAFQTASRIHRSAPTPHLREGLVHIAHGRDDLAIECFRRALTANKQWVLRRQKWIEQLLRTYLRRADLLVARRRKGEALALLDEVSNLDLAVADLDLRLAVTRRRDRLLVDRPRLGVSLPPRPPESGMAGAGSVG